MLLNKTKIKSVITTGQFSIDPLFALAELERYLNTLQALSAGELTDATTKKEDVINNSVIPLKGTMFVDDTWCEYGALSICNMLDEAYSNSDIPFVVMEVDSGGGIGQAGYLIRDKIAEKNKPVYAWVINAGSAAYNAISTADKILLANESSQVGSIGAYYSLRKDVAAEYGKLIVDVYAKQSVDKNAAGRAFVLNGDTSIFEKQATEAAQQFIDSVKANRPDVKDEALTGNMYAGEAAIKMGLADEIVGSISNVGKYINQKSLTKKSDTSMKNLINLLNSLFGVSIKSEATADEAVEQLKDMKPVSEQVASAVDAKLTVLNEAVQSMQTKQTEFENKIAEMTTKTTQLTKALQDAEAKAVRLEAEKEALQTELVEAKKLRTGGGNDITEAEAVFEGEFRKFTVTAE